MIPILKRGQMSTGMMIILGCIALLVIIAFVYSNRATIASLKDILKGSDSSVTKCTSGIDCSFDSQNSVDSSSTQSESTQSETPSKENSGKP
jgi:cytoskeletal protein RodZ